MGYYDNLLIWHRVYISYSLYFHRRTKVSYTRLRRHENQLKFNHHSPPLPSSQATFPPTKNHQVTLFSAPTPTNPPSRSQIIPSRGCENAYLGVPSSLPDSERWKSTCSCYTCYAIPHPPSDRPTDTSDGERNSPPLVRFFFADAPKARRQSSLLFSKRVGLSDFTNITGIY